MDQHDAAACMQQACYLVQDSISAPQHDAGSCSSAHAHGSVAARMPLCCQPRSTMTCRDKGWYAKMHPSLQVKYPAPKTMLVDPMCKVLETTGTTSRCIKWEPDFSSSADASTNTKCSQATINGSHISPHGSYQGKQCHLPNAAPAAIIKATCSVMQLVTELPVISHHLSAGTCAAWMLSCTSFCRSSMDVP
jgi:hypothetical protein